MSSRWIKIMQGASIALIWVFVFTVAFWIVSLLRVAMRHDDSLSASVAIGIVAIPLFFTIASILTYVFVGLQRARDSEP